ncbi:hypothetical protein M8C21_014488 [Ambrosia artemisiifolia]|uniref:Uncharacterized protein n=1 Tax=Ambrosia artemisiifolia TaxID=4212 RepID=A0AAD5DBQ3_AMBAR|nr:hypothetical protein M8C21_014488 [Ambrosia artemisiifolia]
MRICKYKRVKPPLPTHLSPSPFLIPPYSLGEFEFGLDACGVSELVFSSSESTQIDMTFKRNFKYTRLAVDEDSKCTFDPRFDFSAETSDKIPWKSIGLALFLLLFGCVLLLLSLAIFTGYMRGDISQAYGLFGLGTLTFLPASEAEILSLILEMGVHKGLAHLIYESLSRVQCLKLKLSAIIIKQVLVARLQVASPIKLELLVRQSRAASNV